MEAVIGGMIIGVAATLMLLFNGRIAGISGIVNGILTPKKNDIDWRISFIGGLLGGGILLQLMAPERFQLVEGLVYRDYIIAGLLVGIGTTLGNGCTSGHGVCGISRLSKRSFISTCTFIATGAATVFLINLLKGL
jgi:uncharacterized protein